MQLFCWQLDDGMLMCSYEIVDDLKGIMILNCMIFQECHIPYIKRTATEAFV